MQRFIQQENIALFKRRLSEVRKEADRLVLLRLLAEEEAKQPALSAGAGWTSLQSTTDR